MKKVLVMAGGTGGHIFPALAVAQALQNQGVEISWVGSKKGLEADVVPKAGIAIDWITIEGLRGKGWLGWFMAPYKLFHAAMQAQQIINKRKPDLVIGMGGFVTGPGGVVAYLNKKPLVIHEQNAIPGLTNRLLGRIASVVLEAFPGAFNPKYHAIALGNPVREAFSRVEPPAVRMTNRGPGLRLLVVGGSLGATALNIITPKTLAALAKPEMFDVWHQTGKEKYSETRRCYEKKHVQARIEPFIDNMSEAYAWADVVLCRAGALTVSELAAIGVASILVPFPHAVDDHQTKNAEFLVRAGAAKLLPQNKLSVHTLSAILNELLKDRSKILAMANAALAKRKLDAASQVAKHCLELANV
ncbi:MAG TPA: undecaprenyldiphospho-muramoylpentapeptide beta-N-acetylglucosaminyltransferase [Gammaproteobacteria bacterium]|nr:undecaprenyldiphospho-muramoylpentapeptide beta-N-acetylglucosaminyltransferase [Gammaproteobacteria bacterium]